jgi:hypothetical protein
MTIMLLEMVQASLLSRASIVTHLDNLKRGFLVIRIRDNLTMGPNV